MRLRSKKALIREAEKNNDINNDKENTNINYNNINNENIIKENMSDKNIIKLKKVFEKKPSHPNIIVNNIIASSEKTLIALNKNNTISILDLYPIQELKIKFQRRFKKRKTEFLTFGVLRKDSNAITTQISIDNNSSPLKLCKNEHFAIATTGLTFEKLYILNALNNILI